MQHRNIRLGMALVALVVLTAACGGGNSVGGGLKADGTKQGGANAIGQATTTTLKPTTTLAPSATTAKPVATTVPVPAAIFKIQDDSKGQYIDPLRNGVHAGALVRFINDDNIPHVIDGKIGSSVVMGPSPAIPPGGQWDVHPTVKGTYDIIDEARPYAAGVTLTVA